jgi:hypothetical protein
MGKKDIVSKETIRRIAIDLALYLLELPIDTDSLEVLETEHQRIEDRRADLVVRLRETSGEAFLLHIEIQHNHDPLMPWRMLRYRADIELAHPEEQVRQYLIYIGNRPLRMAAGIHKNELEYSYNVLDMGSIDCSRLLALDNPDALVLAILCDFRGREPQAVVNHIVGQLHEKLRDNPKRFREYIDMLEILSSGRELEQRIKEAQQMLTRIDRTTTPTYLLGLEAGEARILKAQLRRKFGELPADIEKRIDTAQPEQLERWAEDLLFADRLEEVFKEA